MEKGLYLRPLILEPNRVERFYIGGKGIDGWQGTDLYGDSRMSEELLVNTNEYIGPGNPPDHGFSRIVNGEQRVSLRDLIDSDPEAALGREYAKTAHGQSAVLCKAGDSTGRLILQYHPTADFARRYLGCPYGKTEAWYILGTRDEKGSHCYAGFKKGVTRESFYKLFKSEDVDGMLGCIHKVSVKKGDLVLIRAGMIHAMGPGVTFLEFHEPCDYTMRFERDNYGRRMEDDDLHYGLGEEKLFDGLNFNTYTAGEIETKVKFTGRTVTTACEYKFCELLGNLDNPEFSIYELSVNGSYRQPRCDGHYIIIAIQGDASLEGDGFCVKLNQGRAAFIPAIAGGFTIKGMDANLLISYPFASGAQK